MAVKSPVISNLNPNAPLFVPYSYRVVEDYSPEWWRLVHTSPAFRDYWLRERQPAAAAEAGDLSLPDDLFSTSDAEEFLGVIDGQDVVDQKMQAEGRAIIGEQNRLNLKDYEAHMESTGNHAFDMKDLVASMKMLDANTDRLYRNHQPFSFKPPKIIQYIS